MAETNMVHDEDGGQDGPRRMPTWLGRHILRLSGGARYLPVAWRVVWFRDEHPDWSIVTELVKGGHEEGYAVVRATVRSANGDVIAEATKSETSKRFPQGWIEKAETGAIGRALALSGYGTQFDSSLTDDAENPADAPVGGRPDAPQSQTESDDATSAGRPAQIWPGPGLCPSCHAPAGKRHGKPCA